MTANAHAKVLVFGMDGATWEILQPLIDAGAVPTMARIAREGARGPLASTVHPHSPTAWTSFLTGMNPGGHGIFDFTRRKQGSYDIEPVSTRSRGGKAIWQILSENGIRCGVLNVPMTYPPEKVAGYFVSGVFTTEPFGKFTYPVTLLDEMAKALGQPYIVDAHRRQFEKTGEEPDEAELADFLQELIDVERRRTDATLFLLKKMNPRFVVHVATSTDRSQHTFWRYLTDAQANGSSARFRDAIASTYVALDAELKRLWEAMGEDATVIVMSDHGGGPLRRVLFINAWLEQQGYLVTEQPAPLSRKALVRSVFRTAYGVGRKVLPAAIRHQIAGRVDVGHRTTMKFLRPRAIDWARSRAFSEGTFGNIVLNVRGREPMGTVSPGPDYQTLRAEIRGKIEALIDPATNAPCVERTYTREELYSGARLEQAPDLIVALKPGYQMVGDFLAIHRGGRKTPTGALFGSGDKNRFRISGIHSPTGILLARGGTVARGARVEGAGIVDLAPTILRTFGLPVPADMDGTVLKELVQ